MIEEMLEDTFEGMDDQEELEEEAQAEVDKILWELTAGELFIKVTNGKLFVEIVAGKLFQEPIACMLSLELATDDY